MSGAPLLVVVALASGIAATATLDAAVGGLVAGSSPTLAARSRWSNVAVLLRQRRTTTERPDSRAWALAPALLMGLAAAMLAVVPVGPDLVLADLPHSIVLFGAAAATVLIPVFLQGWAPNSPFPLAGAFRMFAQGLSSVIPFALVLIGAALPAESLGVVDVVESQRGLWNVLRQPLGLPVYLAAATGVLFWGPLGTPTGADLAGGIELEASGTGLLLWRLSHFGVVFGAAALGAAVFLGGWHGPLLPGPVWVFSKTMLLVAVLSTARHLLPRVRIEGYVVVAWVALLPLSLLDVFLVGWWLL
jgi:NADH-quinone oxidoreductase subunit H